MQTKNKGLVGIEWKNKAIQQSLHLRVIVNGLVLEFQVILERSVRSVHLLAMRALTKPKITMLSLTSYLNLRLFFFFEADLLLLWSMGGRTATSDFDSATIFSSSMVTLRVSSAILSS